MLLATALFPLASVAAPSAAELATLSLEQLSNIEVTSVSRRPERLSAAAGSVFVITAEDIRRSGATSLPEVLRLAPNLQLARADANQYAITARGFNSTTANKMLVQIDGRTIYSPLFSGVFWEVQDLMLEDVERIEVMSGSGGTVWGSNAVNGFINIITKRAGETQGALVAVGGGNRERQASVRYGGTMRNDGHYRFYGRVTTRDHTENAAGGDIRDGSRMSQTGFRADWGTPEQGLTLQGDIYTSQIDQGLAPEQRQLAGANLLGRLVRDLADGSSLRLQAYYDRTERDQPGTVRDALDTFDVELQRAMHPRGIHTFMWGGGYRFQRDRLDNIGPVLAFYPPNQDLTLVNVFGQDSIALRPDLDLTLGLKLEHNGYTGLESLPNARLAWRWAPDRLLWAAVSRAVRIPSRLDRELFIPAQAPFATLAGGPNFDSEVARVVELGYRAQPWAAASYSVTLFHHVFDRLRSLEPTPAGPQLENRIGGRTTGVEAWGKVQVNDWWRLNAGFMVQRERLRLLPGSAALGGVATLGNDPDATWLLGSSFDLGRSHELDLKIRHVGSLPDPTVPGYTVVDARLGWRVDHNLELSLTAQNLLNKRHAEWGVASGRALYGRAVFLKLLWRP